MRNSRFSRRLIGTIVAIAVAVVPGTALLAGCSSTPSAATVQVDPKLVARGTVETLETAWMVTAQACVGIAQAQSATDEAAGKATLAKCESVLSPARDALISAGYAVDGWTAADQGNLPCLIADTVSGMRNIAAMVAEAGVALPSGVQDAFAMAALFTPQCTQDGGSK